MANQKPTKGYLIGTLILAIIVSLIFMLGIALIVLSIGEEFLWLLFICGILLTLIAGFVTVLAWIGFKTAVQTYTRKSAEAEQAVITNNEKA